MTGYITAGELEDKIVEEIIELNKAYEVIQIYDPIEYIKELGESSPINDKLFGENLSEYQKNLLKIARINSGVKCLHELYKQHFPETAYETFKKETLEEYVCRYEEFVDRGIRFLGRINIRLLNNRYRDHGDQEMLEISIDRFMDRLNIRNKRIK